VVSANEFSGVDMLNPRGTRVELSPGQVLCWDSPIQGPVWSSNGSWVGYTIHYRDSTGRINHDMVVVNASTGEIHRYQPLAGALSRFTGWADNEDFIEVSGHEFYIRDAASGKLTNRLIVPDWIDDDGQITPVPPQTGAFYVTSQRLDGDTFEIRLLNSNFTVQKTVYRGSQTSVNPAPRVDPFGEFVAWSTGSAVAFKPLSTSRLDQPSFVGRAYPLASFCDWTEDGRILASVAGIGGAGRLVVLDRYDRLYAELPGGAASPRHSGTASWRKYMHK